MIRTRAPWSKFNGRYAKRCLNEREASPTFPLKALLVSGQFAPCWVWRKRLSVRRGPRRHTTRPG